MYGPNRDLSLRLTVLCAALSLVPQAQAVNLSPHGTGQVLIYPYYTVNGGQNTFLSLVNTTAQAKALKLHFRENYNGREVLGFNLYLAPYDVWTGAVFALSEGGGANLLTEDRSCTVPALRDSTTLPALGDGRRYVPFTDSAYAGAYDDWGPTHPAGLIRTREGSIEVIEMGEVLNGSPSGQAIAHADGVPVDCARLVRAWDNSGYWSTSPDTDISNPGGGLYGTLAVVNAVQGTIFEVAATGLDGFSSYAQHNAPGNAHPDLSDARTSPRDANPPYADAEVPVGTAIVRARYKGADRTVDAVSAVLTVASLRNEFSANPEDGSNTDWVITFPTKRHYVDKAPIAGASAVPPFFARFEGGKSCVIPYFQLGNRTGGYERVPPGPSFFNQPPPPYALCRQTNVGSMYGASGDSSYVLASQAPDEFPPYSRFPQFSSFRPVAGILDVDLLVHAELRPDEEGRVFEGLPALGFMVTKFASRYVGGALLANYTAAVPHRSAARCWSANYEPCK